MLKVFDRRQKTEAQLLNPHPEPLSQRSNVDSGDLTRMVGKLQTEEAELLTIASHLSQAVTRLGCTSSSLDSWHEHNEVIANAQKCQADLQEWIARSRAQSMPRPG